MFSPFLLLLAALPLGVPAPQECATPGDPLARLRAHYERVERELRAATPALDPERAAARARTLDALHDYWTAGEFGRVVLDDEGQRVFRFVDDGGRRCAVAQLLHRWDEDELVAAVAATDNGAMVEDLREHPELLGWLDRVGLTLEEAIRIQAPATMRPSSPPTPRLDLNERATPSVPPRAASPATGPPDAARAPLALPPPESGRAAMATAGGSATPPAITGMPSGVDFTTHWWAWWEFHKLAFLPQGRSLFDVVESDGDGGEGTRSESLGARLRRSALPLLEAGLTDADARVRAAAVVAYARVRGEGATEHVLPLLEDAQRDVRVSAILALGAVGSPRSTFELMRLLRAEESTDGKREGLDVGYEASIQARIALGLSLVGSGMSPADVPLPADHEGRITAESMACLQTLVADPAYASWMRAASGLFDDRGRPLRNPRDASPRVIEALRHDDPDRVLPALVHAVGARRLDVRRAAAATLGTVRSKRALPVLETAFEMEKEALTRGLLLIAIAEQGGDDASTFLLEDLRRGRRSTRPWTALALGLLAGREDRDEVRLVLRRLYPQQSSRDAQDAFLLAMGLARDGEAKPILENELRFAKNALTRANAALALALSGAEGAAVSLREALERETADLTRSTIAQALGVLGEEPDGARLVRFLEEVEDPLLVVQHAAAIAFHGGVEPALALIELLEREDLDAARRVGAYQALGMLLDEEPPFRLAALSRHANFAIFPPSLNAALTSTL